MNPQEQALIDRVEALAGVDADGIPLLAAVPRTDWPEGLRVWCRYCSRWHDHGKGYGHRVAHCGDLDRRGRPVESPYTKTGYCLVDPTTLVTA